MKILRHIVSYVAAVVAIFFFNSSTSAQTPVYHPGQTIRISITFEGADAEKITTAQFDLTTGDQLATTQPNFSREMFPGASKRTAPNTFELSYTIPDSQASGEYTIAQIRAIVSTGTTNVSLFYEATKDFPTRKFKVDNPTAITKPTIKDVKELP